MNKFSIKNVNTGEYRGYVFAECDVYLSGTKVMTFADDGRSCGQHYHFENQAAKDLVLSKISEDDIEEFVSSLVNAHDFNQAVKKKQSAGIIHATLEEISAGEFKKTRWVGHTVLSLKKRNRMDLVSAKVRELLAEGQIILNIDYLVKHGATV